MTHLRHRGQGPYARVSGQSAHRSVQTPTHPQRLLLLLSIINFFNFFDRQLLAALAEPIKGHFALTDARLGSLNSAFELVYSLAALGFALAADKWVRNRIIAAGVAIWSLATTATGAANSFLAVALARGMLGLGCGGYGPAGMALLSDAFPSDHRSRAVAVHDSGLMVGAALGAVLGGMLGEAFGWRVPFLAAGIPGLVLALLAWRIREPARGASEYATLGVEDSALSPGGGPDLSWRAVRRLLGVRTLWAVYGADVLIAFASSGLIFWLPSFLVRMHNFSLGRAGQVAGALQVVTGLIGILLGGWLADRWVQRHPGGRMLTLGAGFLLGTPFAVVAVLTTNLVLFGVTAGLAVICYTVYFPCLAPQIHDVTPPALRATALAINILLGHILGNLPSVPLVGWLSDVTGDLRLALLAVPLIASLGGLVALLGARSAGADRQQMLSSLTIN
jgi:predicted MFS family arabinose efflux permease